MVREKFSAVANKSLKPHSFLPQTLFTEKVPSFLSPFLTFTSSQIFLLFVSL
jgi:hypothetical protein